MSSVPFRQANSWGSAFSTGNPIGLVLHRTEGHYRNILNTWTTGPNPGGASAHFLVGKDEGDVVQLVDTSFIAKHVRDDANPFYLGIEFESIPANPHVRGQDPAVIRDGLRLFQIDIGRRIVDWICRTHNIPKVGPPTPQQWQTCQGCWNGILGHQTVASGGFYRTTHGDHLMFNDYMSLGIFPSGAGPWPEQQISAERP
jgi:hypothetical protein